MTPRSTSPHSLCLACFSSILSAPSSDEKPRPVFRTPCCDRPLCHKCMTEKPRLMAYCLFCQKAMEVVGSPEKARQGRLESEQHLEDGDFVIGEDDEDDEKAYSLVTTDDDRSTVVAAADDEDAPDYDTRSLPPAYDFDDERPPRVDAKESSAGDKDVGNGGVAMHYVLPDDTLAGLALRYKVDGRHLALINHLPASTLTTTPSLIHTRPFIILPPHIPSSASSSPSPLLSEEEQRFRANIRRFQMATKVPDWGVAKAYLEVILQGRRAEAAAEGEGAEIRTGGEVEEAVNNWRTDEEWERKQNVNGASSLKGKGLASLSRTNGPWTSGQRGVAMGLGTSAIGGPGRPQRVR